MYRRSKITMALVAAALLTGLLAAAPATGIVYGEPDNGNHPMVGSMVYKVDFEDGTEYFQVCTGTAVEGAAYAFGKTVFLTAAHCVFDADSLPEFVEVLVTFDDPISPDGTFYSGDVYYDERFATHGSSDLFDVGVIVLDEDPDVGYADIAGASTLDELKKAGELKDQTFTTVGYGTVRETRKKSFVSILDNLARNRADQQVLSLTKAWVTFGMNQAYGGAGTCYGDSGGPHFLGGTLTIVALTSTGDIPCKATDKSYRIDTPQAREFLEGFVALP